MTSLEYRGLSKQELKQRNRISMAIIAILVVVGGLLGWKFQLSQEKANEERSRAQMIVNSAPLAMVMCDEKRQITVFNPAAEEMFGCTYDEVAGQPMDRLLAPGYRDAHDDLFGSAITKLRASDGNWLYTSQTSGDAVRHDGTVFAVVVTVRGIKYGDRVEFIAIIRKVEPDAAPPTLQPLPANLEQRAQTLKR